MALYEDRVIVASERPNQINCGDDEPVRHNLRNRPTLANNCVREGTSNNIYDLEFDEHLR